MGCGSDIGNFMSWTVDPVGNALGLKGGGDLLSGAWWNLGKDVKNDWRLIKHLLVADTRRDREITTNSAETYRRLIYGRAKVGIQLAYLCTSGGNNENLDLIGIFCGHPIDSFESVYAGDKLVTDATIAPYFKYELFDGTQTAACASMIAASGGLWTSAHILRGCAYIYAKLTYNEAAYPSGLPQIKAVVKGRPVYDPRTGLTAWSDNPALCARDYMILANEYGGMGCNSDEIPTDAEIIERANYCDQLVM